MEGWRAGESDGGRREGGETQRTWKRVVVVGNKGVEAGEKKAGLTVKISGSFQK